MADKPPYNPLDKENLGISVADALIAREPIPLNDIRSRGGKLQRFNGAGIYAIYYRGNFKPYASIATKNVGQLTCPIYVGKAVPEGARKGIVTISPEPGQALFNRLKEHADSIRQVYKYSEDNGTAENIDPEHFFCRFLLVDDIWIPLGESMMIARFQPIWNVVIDGFGNHDPGKGRYRQMRSAWDTLHPGRRWAFKCQLYTKTAEQIISELDTYLTLKA
jgi:Eco29kI restriction endonuclease